MTATTIDSSIDPATTSHFRCRSIHSYANLVILYGIVVKRTILYLMQILLLRLSGSGHVNQNRTFSKNRIECCNVLGYHCLVHLLVKLFYALLVIHIVVFVL